MKNSQNVNNNKPALSKNIKIVKISYSELTFFFNFTHYYEF